ATNPAQFKLPDDHVTDGYGKEVSLLMGLNSADGRGNFTAYASWQQIDQVLQANRDYSACSLDTAPPTVQFLCGGSSTSYPGRFTNFLPVGNPASVNATVDSTGAGNTFRSFSAGLDQYNFGPLNHYQRPEQRYALGGMGHFELNDRADVYTQLMFSDYRSIAQIAPGGDFGDTTQLNCDNPLMSVQQKNTIGCTAAQQAAVGVQKDIYLLRRNVEGGGRQQDFHNNSFRGIVGVRGDLSKAWSYDASAQFSRVTADQKTLNYFVTERIQRALDVVAGPNGPTCRSVINGTDKNCVPYNVFQIGGVTPAALNYLQAPGLQTGIIDQELYNASFTGDLGSAGVKLPTANEAVSVALGAEYRRDKLVNTTDSLLTTAALSGTGGPTISVQGATQVTDLFTEVRIPIANDKTFAKKLGVELAYRFSDYGNSLTTDTYKVSADWAPIDAVRFRGSFQRAVRAANIVELFTAQGFNLFDMTGDPCGAAARNPNATAAKCIASGVPAANVGSSALDSPAGQFQYNQGGNPNLQPEKSDTVSFGIVFT
ncbi:MAG: TonB-dependent receptor, partial [Steroidobacteraceae bacterium]